MPLTWRERLRQHPHLADTTAWPPLDPMLISSKHRRRYLRNRRVVQEVLKGRTAMAAAEVGSVCPSRVTQLLNRCLGGSADTAPNLWHGLVPYQPLAGSGMDMAGGGRFRRLLREASGLRSGLDEMLLARLKDKPWAEVVSPARYHSEFKRLLARANWPMDAYPYTTASMAYESVRQDLHTRWMMMCQAQKARRKSLTGAAKDLDDRWLYDRIEIDEQSLDCITSSVDIEIDCGPKLPPMRLTRLTLLAAVDTATGCILAFQLALTEHARQDDLLALLKQCFSRSPKRELTTPGLELPPGAGFPNTAADIPLPLPREIALDNARMHHANDVETFVMREPSSTLSFGPAASPTVRKSIEAVFHRVNVLVSQRFASTTGSSVTDPKRESAKNRKGVPTISLTAFEDALYVAMAEVNSSVRANLATASPLDVVRLQAEECYLVDVDDDQRHSWDPFRQQQEVTVHTRTDLKRKPYVNFEYLRYKGPGLLAVPANEPTVLIVYDRRDIRQLAVYRTNGQALGQLGCPASWRSHAHSIATRRYLFKKYRRLVRSSLDPLTEFLHLQREQMQKPSDVVRFLRTYQEFTGGFGLPTSLWPKPEADSTPENSPPPAAPVSVEQLPRRGRTPTPPRHRYWSIKLNPGGPP